MSEYFLQPNPLGGKVKFELDLSNYATKTDLKNATGVGLSKFDEKVNLAHLTSDVDKSDIGKLKNLPTNLINLKSKIDKLDVDKSLPVSLDLSKLRDIAKNDVVKKDVYNVKIKNIEDKIPSITNLPTKAALNAVTTDYNTNITEIKKKVTGHKHDKDITTPEFKKLTAETFAARLEQANLASQSDIANFINKIDFDNKVSGFNKRIDTNKTKHTLVENRLNELLEKFELLLTKGYSFFMYNTLYK